MTSIFHCKIGPSILGLQNHILILNGLLVIYYLGFRLKKKMEGEDKLAPENLENASPKNQETRDEILARHR